MFVRHKKNMKYALYGRVSSIKQKDEETIEMQKDELHSYVEQHHLDVYDEYYDEAQSGTLPFSERPEGKRLLTDAKAGHFNAVIFYRTDRLGRSAFEGLRVCQQLMDLGVAIQSINETYDTYTSTGKFIFTQMLAIAEMELSTIKTRMNDGKQRKLRRGMAGARGRALYGYKTDENGYYILDNTIVYADKTPVDIIRYIYQATIDENASSITLSNRLNTMQVPGPIKYWNSKKILDIIKNPAYKGILDYYNTRSELYDDRIEIPVPSIVSPEIWQKANDGIKQRQIYNRQAHNHHHYLLGQGIVRCGNCGYAYTGIYYKDRAPTATKKFYKCNGRTLTKYKKLQNKPVCTMALPVPGEWLENVVWAECCKLLTSKSYAEQVIAAYYDTTQQQNSFTDTINILQSSLDKLEQERQDLISLCLKKIISDDDLAQRLPPLDQQIVAIKAELKSHPEALSQADVTKEIRNTKEMIHLLQKMLPMTNDFYVKRALVQLLVHSVVVTTHEDKSFTIDINLNFGPQGLGNKLKGEIKDFCKGMTTKARYGVENAMEILKNAVSFNTCICQAGINRADGQCPHGDELIFRR